jgi:two-component system chemotaxis sensor kinase CheA
MEYSDIVEDVDRMSQKIKEDAKPGDLVTEDLLLFMKSMHEHLNQILDFRLREIEQIYNPPEYCEKRLGEILIAEHKITSEELENALGKQRKLGEVLVESGKVKK